MTSANLQIHHAGPEDADLIHQAAALFDQAPRDDATARFLGSEDHHLFLALEAGEPVGFLTGVELTHPDKGVEMFLYELAVAEGARRQRIGRALVEALAELARQRGCRGMWVLTDEDNVAAVTTYRSAGATKDERTFLLEWTF
jgi:ribosomal protein S18 acetylase RimI-like enzyme